MTTNTKENEIKEVREFRYREVRTDKEYQEFKISGINPIETLCIKGTVKNPIVIMDFISQEIYTPFNTEIIENYFTFLMLFRVKNLINLY